MKARKNDILDEGVARRVEEIARRVEEVVKRMK